MSGDRLARQIRKSQGDSKRKASASKSGIHTGDPLLDEHLTDAGNARRFVHLHGHDLRYCHQWGKWICSDGCRWKEDDAGTPDALAKVTSRRTLAAAAKLASERAPFGGDDPGLRRAQQVMAYAIGSESAFRLASMVRLARSEPGIPIRPADLNTDPWALNCPNGTINLRTGELRPNRREDYLTSLCPTPYVPDARCPVFEATLAGIFAGDTAMIDHVQRFLGYATTGDVSEHVFPVWFGIGANGKSTLLTALQDTLGEDYAGVVPPELLMEQPGSQHPTVIAKLFGKRLMVAVETGDGRRLNEPRLKALTGGDRISARRCREDFWDFRPTHKLILATNYKPEVRGQDHAIWRRLALWPFTRKFWDPAKGESGPVELEADKQLGEKLRGEAEGILAWLIRGCLAWQQSGLALPPSVLAVTAEYRNDQDAIARFLNEHCVSGSDSYRVRAARIFEAYDKWAKGGNEPAMNQRRFGEAMTERGFQRFTNNGTWYRGVALREDETLPD